MLLKDIFKNEYDGKYYMFFIKLDFLFLHQIYTLMLPLWLSW